ncbi:DUF4964 domain-containing protein [Natronoglomus mannanivorans]|uniref:DUF4964 domain-containing protein n=1 Tax=Natronoglomus mannanivorans TaxID=2979990 RepID=UPI003CCD0B88
MSTSTCPAVPLVTHHPYFSVWSPTDELHGSETVHWTGTTNSMLGFVSIDGTRYRFAGCDPSAGAELPVIEQTDLDVRPTTSEYTFEADGVELVVSFTSPLLLADLEVLSRSVVPLSHGSSRTFRTTSRHSPSSFVEHVCEPTCGRPLGPVCYHTSPITE